MAKKKTFGNYDKNNKPLVETESKKAFSKQGFRQGDMNNAPVTKPTKEKSAFSDKVMPKNKVSKSSSTKVQKAVKTAGRVNLKGGSDHKKLVK